MFLRKSGCCLWNTETDHQFIATMTLIVAAFPELSEKHNQPVVFVSIAKDVGVAVGWVFQLPHT